MTSSDIRVYQAGDDGEVGQRRIDVHPPGRLTCQQVRIEC